MEVVFVLNIVAYFTFSGFIWKLGSVSPSVPSRPWAGGYLLWGVLATASELVGVRFVGRFADRIWDTSALYVHALVDSSKLHCHCWPFGSFICCVARYKNESITPTLCWNQQSLISRWLTRILKPGFWLTDSIAVSHVKPCLSAVMDFTQIIWRHWSGSTLAQVMDCCLAAPSWQCWHIISKVQRHPSEGNFTSDSLAINHWNYIERLII